MKHLLGVLSRATRIFAATAAIVALGACMIMSDQPLFAAADATTPLPPQTFLFGYADDTFARNAEAPLELTLNGKTYTSADGAINVMFVPRGEPGSYIIAMVGPDGQTYGTARIRDNLMAVTMVLGDNDPDEIVAAEKAAAGGVLDDVTVKDGSISVHTREALDYILGMAAAEKLRMTPIVVAFAGSADAEVPAKLVRDGDFWKPE